MTSSEGTVGRHRAWLLLPAGLAMLAGVDAGLVRFGIRAPVGDLHLADVHGPLMVLGFLGTVIALERAVALRARVGYLAPALLGAGALALVRPGSTLVGKVLLLDGAVALVALLVALWHRRREDTVAVQALAATAAALAALLWTGVDARTVVPLLVAFVVLTIVAERVELARLHLPAAAERYLVALAVLCACAAVAAVLLPGAGPRALGVVLVTIVVWIAPKDVARRTIHSTGLPRFAAAAMLAGYAWLLVAGVVWTAVGATRSSSVHDVVVHTVFLGFAMSMVLAHAPVILPAVLRRPLPYRAILWIPLALLHLGLAVRVGGDLGGATSTARAGAWVTALALVALPATVVACVLGTRPGRARPVADPPVTTSEAGRW